MAKSLEFGDDKDVFTVYNAHCLRSNLLVNSKQIVTVLLQGCPQLAMRLVPILPALSLTDMCDTLTTS